MALQKNKVDLILSLYLAFILTDFHMVNKGDHHD